MTAKKRGATRGTAQSTKTRAPRAQSKTQAGEHPAIRRRPTSAAPSVLFIDDQADTLERTIGLEFRGAFDTTFRQPADITAGDVWKADVIMVDFDLAQDDATSLKLGSGTFVTAQLPKDGLGLIGALRRITEQSPKDATAAYVIFTGDATKLPGHVDLEGREQILAAAYGVEWIFEKSDDHLVERVDALARAVRGLGRSALDVKHAVNAPPAFEILCLPTNAGWRNDAIEQIRSSEPPLDASLHATQGIALLRWLLHGILPYPTFLLSARHLAARLRVTPDSLSRVLARDSSLARFFAPARYTGILNVFSGDRWWRAGVEALLWSLTDGDPDPATLRAALKRRAPSVQESDALQPVVALDASLRETDTQVNVDAAVEVRPEGWPSYADPAWLPADLVQNNPDLRSVIVARDQDRVSPAPQ